jgi:arginyl-tRNA synthetase
METLGHPSDSLQILLYQYVALKNAGEVVKMGKRLGNFVTLRQLIEGGVAPDAFKYFIVSQNPNTPFAFDFELAKDTSEKNPVFYIKYAHARIASILRKASEENRSAQTAPDLLLLKTDKERALYVEIAKFPEIIAEIAENFQVQALPHFAYKVASLFHDFYTNCQVLSADKELTAARLALITATKYVLANALTVLDIEAPEKM